ncbi:class I SAM-dependent methyltransferase [Bacteroides sp. 519]|uniref:class I SAM-dependent DNA methyltransferase n=1 Tax=Bacteroides sp. 519 TaxID=2302937 RepID=UPI0013D76AD5|nr:class I SAM-dependent methyltransferase [Bacteroides sp. 519]NDV57972.1 class I SAM-dependent methyltransferase [Bacteroides sp. 519]
MNEYTEIAEFYDEWSKGDPAAQECIDFYVDMCYNENDIVELGVGTGRIAIEIAKKGKKITGIDICQEMLDKFYEKSIIWNIQDKINIICSDVKNFKLNNKANLITFPFRSIGHLLSLDEKEVLLKNVYLQLSDGGQFVFDHYIFNKSWADQYNNISRLMYFYEYEGVYNYIWDTYNYNYKYQLMNCFVTIEKSNQKGVIFFKKIIPFKFSWIYPEQVENLIHKTGFKVIDVYGDFKGNPLTSSSDNQIWILQK